MVPVLEPVMNAMAAHFGQKARGQAGRQHELDAEYFDRIEAMNFALSHDDGQSSRTYNDADVILVGVSRSSKTPTCIYLANRGIKCANVPIVPNCPLPPELFQQFKERVDIDFDHANPTHFSTQQAVRLDVHLKNVPKLLVKVFEINTANYYRDQQREINTDVNLDGRVIAAGPSNDINYIYNGVFLHPANTTIAANFIIQERLP